MLARPEKPDPKKLAEQVAADLAAAKPRSLAAAERNLAEARKVRAAAAEKVTAVHRHLHDIETGSSQANPAPLWEDLEKLQFELARADSAIAAPRQRLEAERHRCAAGFAKRAASHRADAAAVAREARDQAAAAFAILAAIEDAAIVYGASRSDEHIRRARVLRELGAILEKASA